MRLKYETNYELRDLQQRLVIIMENIDKVCREHGLRYYLWAGTQLGAVRHKGFIPWDDDADLAMPRPDYDILMEHSKEWLPAPYEIIGPHVSSNYPHRFAKVIDSSTTLLERPDMLYPEGVYVDIFPLDGFPEDARARKSQLNAYRHVKKKLFFACRDPYKHGGGPSAWFCKFLQKFLSVNELQQKLQEVMKRYRLEDCDSFIEYDYGRRAIFKKSLLDNPVLYEFEGKQFYGLADADYFLTTVYGDYMTPPPVEKQVQHRFLYLDFNKPYREFVAEGNVEKYALKH